MPEKEDSALSQEAIDALLAGGAAVSDKEEDEVADHESSDDDAAESAELDPFAIEDESESTEQAVEGKSEDEVESSAEHRELTEMNGRPEQFATRRVVANPTGTSIDSATSSPGNDFAALTRRIEAVEQAAKTIAALEKQVQSLKKTFENKKETEAIRKRLTALESGVRNTPAYNLYEKITCPSCGTHGAAQVKTRCPGCGKEGWFGRRTPIEPQLSVVTQQKPAVRPPAKPALARAQALQRPVKRAA